MQNEILRIEHLSKQDHMQNILRSVSLQISSGQKAALLSNPLEKQSIINILFKEDNPDTGKIFINERLCNKNISKSLKDGGIYYIEANTSMIFEMTVAKNIILNIPDLISNIWVMDRILIRRVNELLQEYGISDIAAEVYVKDLSYCQILCLEIVIAVQKGAKLIVFDDFFNQIGEGNFNEIEKMINFLYEKGISVLLLANRFHSIFVDFDSLFVLRNGITTGVLKKNKISFHRVNQYYSPVIGSQNIEELSRSNYVLTVKCNMLKLSLDRGDILGVWSLNGDYLMQIGKQQWELFSLMPKNGTDIAVSVNDYKEDKIYKDMSLVDNITYLAQDKISNSLGIINKRLQQHMAYYSLELIHSEYLMEKYKTRKNLKGITLIDQMRVITAKWLCVTPQVFIYVNPFVILDESTIQEFREILQDLIKLKISVIIMSVNRMWLEQICDRVISVDKKASIS